MKNILKMLENLERCKEAIGMNTEFNKNMELTKEQENFKKSLVNIELHNYPEGYEHYLYNKAKAELYNIDWELLPTFHKFETALKSYHKGNIIYYHEDNVPYPVKFCTKVTGAYVDISNCVVRNMYDEKVESYMFAPERILSNRWVIEGN